MLHLQLQLRLRLRLFLRPSSFRPRLQFICRTVLCVGSKHTKDRTPPRHPLQIAPAWPVPTLCRYTEPSHPVPSPTAQAPLMAIQSTRGDVENAVSPTLTRDKVRPVGGAPRALASQILSWATWPASPLGYELWPLARFRKHVSRPQRSWFQKQCQALDRGDVPNSRGWPVAKTIVSIDAAAMRTYRICSLFVIKAAEIAEP